MTEKEMPFKIIKIIILGCLSLLIILGVSLVIFEKEKESGEKLTPSLKTISLPDPLLKSKRSLEEAIKNRRSQREFKKKPLTIQQVSQLVWVGQGITDEKEAKRSAPSAGALYPLEIYLAVSQNGVENLESGVYHYIPQDHQLEFILAKDIQKDLMEASLNQGAVGNAPVDVVIVVDYEITAQKYGERAERYVYLEAGHVAQNILLEVVSQDLAAVPIGAFEDEAVIEALEVSKKYTPLYVIPVGYPR